MLAEISQEIFQKTSQIVRSYFEVLCWKSFDQTFIAMVEDVFRFAFTFCFLPS